MSYKEFKTNGIYKISFVGTNYFYIGSTTRKINLRLTEHLNRLKKSNHFNKHLQSCFNKYGESSLLFEVVEELPTETKLEILQREKYWIETLQPPINIQQDPTKIVINGTTCENHGHAIATNKDIAIIKGLVTQGLGREEIKDIVDLSQYKDPSSLIKGLRYHNRWKDVEPIEDYVASYEVTSPDGTTYITTNLYGFKKQHKCPWKVYNVFASFSNNILPSEIRSFDGWTFKVSKYPDINHIHNKDLLSCSLREPRKKLDEEQIKEIIQLIKDNELTYVAIADIYKVNEHTIRSIGNGESHKHITKLTDKIDRKPLTDKIDKETALEIRRLRNDLNWSTEDVAKTLGITTSIVTDVSIGNSWTDVGGTIRPKGYYRGANRVNAKLNEDKAKEIKLLLEQGTPGNLIAKQFGIAPSTVSEIKHGRRWS